jgi:hypothetical protein
MSQSQPQKKRAYDGESSSSSESQEVDADAKMREVESKIKRAIDDLSGAEARERMREVFETLQAYIGVDGDHHKQWALLKAIRLLVGQKMFDTLIATRDDVGYETNSGMP